jgi:hypothetical protein
MKELLIEIRKDPNYRKLQQKYEKVSGSLDLDALYKEATGLQSGRLSRNISGDNRYSPKFIIDANLRDLSYRARLVEIRVSLDRKLKSLEEMVQAVKRYVSTEYAEDLSELRTAEQRRNFANRVVKNQEQYLADGNSLVGSIDLLIKDIDQASYHFKTIIECLKLLDSSRGGKTI